MHWSVNLFMTLHQYNTFKNTSGFTSLTMFVFLGCFFKHGKSFTLTVIMHSALEKHSYQKYSKVFCFFISKKDFIMPEKKF